MCETDQLGVGILRLGADDFKLYMYDGVGQEFLNKSS